eukprot:snap_masked-scaffold_6-processed-gene-15.50-mRNA-1 protein AED:1.00 eAED:1.00 QI:0/0/0/0/1/1/2/0/419
MKILSRINGLRAPLWVRFLPRIDGDKKTKNVTLPHFMEKQQLARNNSSPIVNSLLNHLSSTIELKNYFNNKHVSNLYLISCESAKYGSFFKDLQLSSDHYMLLTTLGSRSNKLFELNTRKEAAKISLSSNIYSTSIYPFFCRDIPQTQCFLSLQKDTPLQLLDKSGLRRATYTALNQVDNVAKVYSTTFTPSGNNIICGGQGCVYLFDTSRPETVRALSSEDNFFSLKRKRGRKWINGIVSCFDFSSGQVENPVIAAGSYGGKVCIFDLRNFPSKVEHVLLEEDFCCGVTKLKFCSDGYKIFVRGRRSTFISLFDLRMFGKRQYIERLKAEADTNLGLGFDVGYIKGKEYLLAGTTETKLVLYNISEGNQSEISSIADINSVKFLKSGTHKQVLVSSGQRYFSENEEKRSYLSVLNLTI